MMPSSWYDPGGVSLYQPLSLNTVAVGMAVTGHPPHRPVLAVLPHTVLTSDVPPQGGWRRNARRDIHEQPVERVASDRIVSPVSPRWAAFGCAVPAHGTSSGRPVAGIATAPTDFREWHGIGSNRGVRSVAILPPAQPDRAAVDEVAA